MTNEQIIIETALERGLFTEEEVGRFLEQLGSLPLHTYSVWQQLGYQVRKGEKAAMSCKIWRIKGKKAEAEAAEMTEEEKEADGRFYKKLAHFFLPSQVDKIEAKPEAEPA